MNQAGITKSEVNIWGLFCPSECDQKSLCLGRQAQKDLHASICNKEIGKSVWEHFLHFTAYEAKDWSQHCHIQPVFNLLEKSRLAGNEQLLPAYTTPGGLTVTGSHVLCSFHCQFDVLPGLEALETLVRKTIYQVGAAGKHFAQLTFRAVGSWDPAGSSTGKFHLTIMENSSVYFGSQSKVQCLILHQFWWERSFRSTVKPWTSRQWLEIWARYWQQSASFLISFHILG